MSYYDDIYELAADNYGLITTSQANKIGAANKDLIRYVSDGRLMRVGRGVYRISHYIPVDNDPYAEAVALVGDDAYLYGESVIAMHNLAPTNPTQIFVATPRRVRKHFPEGLVVKDLQHGANTTSYEGIPSQTVYEAIKASKTHMLPTRLKQAIHNAREAGLIKDAEEQSLMGELD